MTNLLQYANAGYNAYHMAYSTGSFGADHKPQRMDNPYSQRPANDLWLKGWRAAQQLHESGVPFSLTPFANDRRILDYIRYLNTKERAKQGRFNKPKPRSTTMSQVFAAPYGKKPYSPDVKVERSAKRFDKKPFVPHKPTAAKPAVLNPKRFEGFNKKNRTAV